jgi:hypothetical protein
MYIRAFGVNVPVTDTWVMAPLFEELFSGELSVGDLWAQHSEHRPLLPRIFLLLMGPLADFNIVTIMYATQLCLLATFVCVFLAYRDTVGLDSKSLFFAVPVSLLVFSFGQYWSRRPVSARLRPRVDSLRAAPLLPVGRASRQVNQVSHLGSFCSLGGSASFRRGGIIYYEVKPKRRARPSGKRTVISGGLRRSDP